MKNKKQLILNAAMILIEKHGINSTTIADIARQAAIGKGTVYEYFNCKNDLLYEVMVYGIEFCLTELEKRIFVHAPSHKQAVYNFIDGANDIIRSNTFLSFFSDPKLFTLDKEKFDQLKKVLKEHYSTINLLSEKINNLGVKEGIIRKADNPLLHFIFSNMIFSTVMQQVNGNISDRTEVKEYLYEATMKLYS